MNSSGIAAVVLVGDETAADIRRHVLSGDIVVFPPTPGSRALAEWTRKSLEAAFAPCDPRLAQKELNVDRYIEILAAVKPTFVHAEESWEHVVHFLTDVGLGTDDVYLDVPRVRLSPSGDYLSVGVAHRQPPHRDTWWGSPFQQMNFWGPVYPMTPENGLVFYPSYFERELPNSSDEFNLYEWNVGGRAAAAKQKGKTDTRGIPVPMGEVDEPGLSISLPVGGIVCFSGAHLHATRPHATGMSRASVDFRAISALDVEANTGPANIDSRQLGTALRDFLQLRSRASLSADLIDRFDNTELPEGGALTFKPPVLTG